MRPIKMILKKKKTKTEKSVSSPQNPYTQGAEGRVEWNDRYMNMKKMIHRWQMAFFFAMTAVVVLACVVGKIATESKVQPFVVETTNGMPYAVKPMESISL